MAGYIDDLDDTYPDGSVHKVFVIDDDLKDIKSKLKDTFFNLTGAVTATQTELNYLVGATGNIQAQINVQAASLATLAAKGVPYSGRISVDGTGLTLPAGWSSNRTSEGNFAVTHNLNGSSQFAVVTLDSTSSTSWFQYQAQVGVVQSGAFNVIITEVSTGALSDCGFYFLVHAMS